MENEKMPDMTKDEIYGALLNRLEEGPAIEFHDLVAFHALVTYVEDQENLDKQSGQEPEPDQDQDLKPEPTKFDLAKELTKLFKDVWPTTITQSQPGVTPGTVLINQNPSDAGPLRFTAQDSSISSIGDENIDPRIPAHLVARARAAREKAAIPEHLQRGWQPN